MAVHLVRKLTLKNRIIHVSMFHVRTGAFGAEKIRSGNALAFTKSTITTTLCHLLVHLLFINIRFELKKKNKIE